MAYGRSNSGAIATLVLGAAAAVVGVLLYRKSGRDWNSDMQAAKDWLDDRSGDAQKVLDKTERASKDLLASAQDYGQQALGSAKGALQGAREQIG